MAFKANIIEVTRHYDPELDEFVYHIVFDNHRVLDETDPTRCRCFLRACENITNYTENGVKYRRYLLN